MQKKILFIGINQRYMNATTALFPAVLSRKFKVCYYGPGYVSESELSKGIEEYIKSTGDIDYIFVTGQCLITQDIISFKKYLTSYTYVYNNGDVTQYFFNDLKQYCKQNKSRVICSILDIDPHVVESHQVELLDENADYFMGWGNGFLDSSSDAEALKDEDYVQKKLKKGKKLGVLSAFVNQNPERIINLGHFVSDNEFYWGNISVRQNDVSVPGASYQRRKNIISKIKKIIGVKMGGTFFSYPFKIANRLNLKPYGNFYLIHIYNLAFQKLLSQSRMCVTEGGAVNYPVRKFFEIPASGSLLVCWPADGLQALGFVSNENCFFVSEQSQVLKLIDSIHKSPSNYEAIASKGRLLVFRQHSVSARAEQLSAVLSAIDKNQFYGSYWENGTFRIITKK